MQAVAALDSLFPEHLRHTGLSVNASACWSGVVNLAIDNQVHCVSLELTRAPGQDQLSATRDISYLLAGMTFGTTILMPVEVQMAPIVTSSSVALSIKPQDPESAITLAHICLKLSTGNICLSNAAVADFPLIMAAFQGEAVLFVV